MANYCRHKVVKQIADWLRDLGILISSLVLKFHLCVTCVKYGYN